MESILRQLYEGGILPAEQFQLSTKEYKQRQQVHYQHYVGFLRTLENYEKILTEQFISVMHEQAELFSMENEHMFTEGFRLGAKMIMEILMAQKENPEEKET